MSEEAGLLDAIVREPDDDLHRLVYADWLEERGQDARAEFIRVQLELARQEPAGARYKELSRREKTLLARNRRRWARPFHPRLTRLGFRRGFVERACVDAGEFLSAPEDLLTCAPIHLLALRDARPHARPLADCRELGWLEGLSVPGVGPAVAELLASPHLGKLQSLDLTRNGLDVAGLASILRRLPSLRVLYLDGNDLDGEELHGTLAALAPRLEVLSVVWNRLRVEDLERLLAALPCLRTLFADWPGPRRLQQGVRDRFPGVAAHFNRRSEWEA